MDAQLDFLLLFFCRSCSYYFRLSAKFLHEKWSLCLSLSSALELCQRQKVVPPSHLSTLLALATAGRSRHRIQDQDQKS